LIKNLIPALLEMGIIKDGTIIKPGLPEMGKIKAGTKGEEVSFSGGKKFRLPKKLDHYIITAK